MSDTWVAPPTARPAPAQGRPGRTRGGVLWRCTAALLLLCAPAVLCYGFGALDEADAGILAGAVVLTVALIWGVIYV